MNRSPVQILPTLAAVMPCPNRDSQVVSPGDSSQESVVSRVIMNVNALSASHPLLPFGNAPADPSGVLINSVIVAFVQGDLQPGDPIPQPPELARACKIPLYDVLAAIARLLSHRILQQNRSGALRIHPMAAPTVEMKQQAFLACSRQLVDRARGWHLPPESLEPLFHKAACEAS